MNIRQILGVIMGIMMMPMAVLGMAPPANAIVNTTFELVCVDGNGHVRIAPFAQTVVIDGQEVGIGYIVDYPKPDGGFYFQTGADSTGKLVDSLGTDVFVPYDDPVVGIGNITNPLDIVWVQAFALDTNLTPLSDVVVYDRDPLCGSRGGTEPPVYDPVVMAGRADGLVNQFRLTNPNTYSVRSECSGGTSATLTAAAVQTFSTTVEYVNCTYYNAANTVLGTGTVRTLQFGPDASRDFRCKGDREVAIFGLLNTRSSVAVRFNPDRAPAETVAARTNGRARATSLPRPGHFVNVFVTKPDGTKQRVGHFRVPERCR